jgi:DNA topoisomerase VI subunit B
VGRASARVKARKEAQKKNKAKQQCYYYIKHHVIIASNNSSKITFNQPKGNNISNQREIILRA